MGNSGIREFALRYDILRGGIKYAEAKAAGPAAVSMDMRRKIKRLFSGDLILPEGIDRLGDRLRPVLILDKAEYPLGQFILTTVKAVREGASCFCRCEGYDLCFLAQRTRLEQKLYFSAGERYTDRIQALLQQCGIQSAIVEESDEMFATDREDWEIGTPVLDIVNSLLDEISYRSLWFDEAGYARISPILEPSVQNIRHRYGPGKEKGYALVQEAYEREDDLFDLCNVFVVQCENPELREMMQAVSINDDPASAVSVTRQGRVMAPPVRLDNISSQAALQRYADRLRWQSMAATETTVIRTALNPTHQCGDILALEGDLAPGVYEESGWAMELTAGGLMEHTLRRILYR